MTNSPSVPDVEDIMHLEGTPKIQGQILLKWSNNVLSELHKVDFPEAKEYAFLLSQNLDLLREKGNSKLRGLLISSFPSYYIARSVDVYTMRTALDILRRTVAQAEIPAKDRSELDVRRLAEEAQDLYRQYAIPIFSPYKDYEHE